MQVGSSARHGLSDPTTREWKIMVRRHVNEHWKKKIIQKEV